MRDAEHRTGTARRALDPRIEERSAFAYFFMLLLFFIPLFMPVVLLCGFGAQLRPDAFAAFSQEAMVLYLQFSEFVPPGAPDMQNADVPVTVFLAFEAFEPDLLMAAPLVSEPLWPVVVEPAFKLLGDAPFGAGPAAFCACAKEMPTTKAATAVNVVNVFMNDLLSRITAA
jgi:hypothetical protein